MNNFIITIAKIDQILSKIYESFEQIKGSYANVLKILNLGNCSEKAMLVIIFLIRNSLLYKLSNDTSHNEYSDRRILTEQKTLLSI